MSSNKDNTMPFFCFKPVRGSPLHRALRLSVCVEEHSFVGMLNSGRQCGTFGRDAQSPVEIFHVVIPYSSSGCGEEKRGRQEGFQSLGADRNKSEGSCRMRSPRRSLRGQAELSFHGNADGNVMGSTGTAQGSCGICSAGVCVG